MRLRKHIPVVLVIAAAAFLLGGGSAHAQPAERGNVAVSYSILHDSELEETFPVGWVFAVSSTLTPRVTAIGEVGGHYKVIDIVEDEALDDDVSVRLHSFLGGVRFVGGGEAFTPFVQMLAGAVSVDVRFNDAGEQQKESVQGFAFQPGGGVDVALKQRMRLRFHGDYRVARLVGESTSEFRFAVGVVFRLGR
jgi:hypothetical protein